MTTKSMGWRPIRRTGGWYVVSRNFKEATADTVGSGCLVGPFKTREDARDYIREIDGNRLKGRLILGSFA